LNLLVKKSDKAETVLNWWENLEQASIKYSLEYNYCIKTDVTNCYGSIYTHSIAWAIMGKSCAKEKRRNKNDFGNQLDALIQELQNGQTNGIPQGGNLFDFIAEIVLGYSDLCLSNRLKKHDFKDNYMIIRYRDDYRIFSNSKEMSETIVKELSQVLSELNMHFNSKKTNITTDIIGTAIKPDKLFWTARRSSIFVKKDKEIEYHLGLQKHLWQIYELSEKYPNSGSVTVALKEFMDRVSSKNQNEEIKDENQLIAILVNIIVKSPKSVAMGAAVLSNLFGRLSNQKDISDYIEFIIKKMKNIPNIGYIEIWLQRLSIIIDPNREYCDPLSKKVFCDENKIWDSEWLKKGFDESSIVDRKIIKNLQVQIPLDEVDLFSEYL
jgi:Reverse transcriptase (RNA-dependent DNA polymerase).